MVKAVGEYGHTLPVNVITDSRVKVGQTSSEVMRLKGKRYVTMQEPTKGAVINDGILKQLTGDSEFQGRGLWKDEESFPILFALTVCTNNLFDINDTTDGFWRRIRKCVFPSLFVPEDQVDAFRETHPYVFVAEEIDPKLPLWAPVFLSILIHKVFETNGMIHESPTIMRASASYRGTQDTCASFVRDQLVETRNPADKIKQTDIVRKFAEWYGENYGTQRKPSNKDFNEYLDLVYGKYKVGKIYHSLVFACSREEQDGEEEEDPRMAVM